MLTLTTELACFVKLRNYMGNVGRVCVVGWRKKETYGRQAIKLKDEEVATQASHLETRR